jgi:hypothetical protein
MGLHASLHNSSQRFKVTRLTTLRCDREKAIVVVEWRLLLPDMSVLKLK